jgi:hypothetical protein
VINPPPLSADDGPPPATELVRECMSEQQYAELQSERFCDFWIAVGAAQPSLHSGVATAANAIVDSSSASPAESPCSDSDETLAGKAAFSSLHCDQHCFASC